MVGRTDANVGHQVTWSLHPWLLYMTYQHCQVINCRALGELVRGEGGRVGERVRGEGGRVGERVRGEGGRVGERGGGRVGERGGGRVGERVRGESW